MLYADERRFLQALEGDEREVVATFRRIDADTLLSRVERLAAGAAPAVRATFEGFVAARRAA